MAEINNSNYTIASIINYGNELRAANEFGDYCAIDLKINNKIYIKTKYGVEECHNLGRHIYEKMLDYIGDKEILSNPFPGAYLGFVKKSKLPLLIEKFNKIKYTFNNSFKDIFDLKIVYYDIKGQETAEHALDNVVTGMEKIFDNPDISIFNYTYAFENKEIEAQRIMNKFDPAIKNKDFIVYYQPKVDSRDNNMYGSEALVRWNHRGEIINPGRFIPVLEKTNRICILDFYILKEVCKDMKSWIEQGIEPVKTSINFSRFNLKYNDFAKRILSIIKSYDIPTKYIEIEITETVKDNELKKIIDFIKEMHKNGIEVSMDDFGSGYASISAFTDLEFDTIKIDKNLTDNLNNKKTFVILSALGQVCKKFGVKTIVEGVETEQQIMMLDTIGYNYIQGYFYDKPLPKEDFTKRLIKRNYTGERRMSL